MVIQEQVFLYRDLLREVAFHEISCANSFPLTFVPYDQFHMTFFFFIRGLPHTQWVRDPLEAELTLESPSYTNYSQNQWPTPPWQLHQHRIILSSYKQPQIASPCNTNWWSTFWAVLQWVRSEVNKYINVHKINWYLVTKVVRGKGLTRNWSTLLLRATYNTTWIGQI